MDLKQLESFVVVAEELHFGRAAVRLMTAQPAVSQRIRQLETELGVQLFERNTRSVRLTSSGESMLRESREILARVEQAKSTARAAGRGDVGIVRIGYGGTTYNATIPTIVAAVREQYPGIELKLESNLVSGKAFDLVADREIDIGFGLLPGGRSGVKTQVLAKGRLVVALPEGHRLASKERIRLAELKDEIFVAPTSAQGSTVRNLLVHAAFGAKFSPRIEFEAPDSLSLLSLVATGLGVTLTLSTLMSYRPEGLVYRELREHVPVAQAMLWHEANTSKAVHTVLRLVMRRAEQDGFLEQANAWQAQS